MTVSVYAGAGNGFVESAVGRPLRDGIVALAALVKANVRGFYFIEHFRPALDEQIGQPWRRAGIDQRDAILFLKAPGIGELLGLEGIAGEVRTEVGIVRAQSQSGAHDDLVKNGSGGIDEELASAGGTNDAAQIAGVDLGDGDGAPGTQKAARALEIAVPAPYGM